MIPTDNPNNILAEKIVLELSEKELISSANAEQIKLLMSEGKMTEKFWIAAFEKKITTTPAPDETKNT